MTPGHALAPSRSHALTRAGMLARLADRFRVRSDLPGPDLDLQDHGDGMDIKQALDALAPLPAPPWEGASLPGQPGRAGSPGYRGQTLVDFSGHAPRRYVPAPVWAGTPLDVRADLDELVLFRAAVRAEIIRREEDAQGRRTPGGTWQARYARTWHAWHERISGACDAASSSLPDFALDRYDGLVDEIVAQAGQAAEAQWEAAQAAAEAALSLHRQEYAGRHAGSRVQADKPVPQVTP